MIAWASLSAMAVALTGALLLPQSSLVPGELRGCDAMSAGAPALLEQEVVFSGTTPFRQQVSAPPGDELLVLAGEHDVDLMLSAGHEGMMQRADSPLQGFGVQHLLLPAGTRHGQVEISAKDAHAPQGSARLRLISLPPGARDHCTRIQRVLASADAAFARGWAIGNGLEAAEAGEADAAYRASIEAYREALANPLPESLRAALVLSVAGSYYYGLWDWESAESWAARAAPHYRRTQDDYGLARAQLLRGMALIEVDPGKVRDSLSRAQWLLRTAAQSHASRGELREQALALNNLGIALYLSGAYTDARESYDRAAGLFDALGEKTRAWQVADNLGLIDYELGRLETAARTYAALLAEEGLRARPQLYLNVLTNGALVQLQRGEAGEALRAYQEALALSRDIQDNFHEALSLQGIGGAYEALGDPEMALTHYQGALRLRTRESGARYRLETLWTLADVERRMGRAERALALDHEGMELADTPIDRARTRMRIATDYSALDQPGRSLEEVATLFERRFPGDVFIRARALLLRGQLLAASGRWQDAAGDLRSALHDFEQLDSASGQFDARMALATLQRDQGNVAAAIEEVEGAIALAERLRLQSANPGLRASALEALRPAHDLKIDLLADASALAATARSREDLAWKAMEVAESARARAMQDYAAIATGITGSSPLLEQRQSLYLNLAQAQARLDRSSLELPADDPVLQTIRENVAGLRGQIDQIETQLAAGSNPASTPATLQAASLPAHTTVVQYWLGAARALAWVAGKNGLRMVSLGPTAPIAEAATGVQAALHDGQNADPALRVAALEKLSRLIWHPLADMVPAHGTVVFIADMGLHYIPFSALVDPSGRFLVDDHNVATAASLRQLLDPGTTPPDGDPRMLIVSDPRYPVDVPRLPGTAREGDAIARIAEGVQVDRLQGGDATRERLLGTSLGDYQYIHIATHALANARIPQLSALRLAASASGGDDRVYAADLLGVKLNARLVVLSACDTALGRVVSGEGVIGLRYVLLARGAQAVVSSLWKVGDRDAEQFMKEFYASMLGGGAPPAAAMSAAMRSLKARHGADPAIWAAFELSVRTLPEGASAPLLARE